MESLSKAVDSNFSGEHELGEGACAVNAPAGTVNKASQSDNREKLNAHFLEYSFRNCDVENIIAVQSLLVQFSHPKVRADLMNGKFSRKMSDNILEGLDELRWSLFPRWTVDESRIEKRCQKSAIHLRKLSRRSNDIFKSDYKENGRCLTYEEWADRLSDIGGDRYWSVTPQEKRCTHIIVSDDSSSSSGGNRRFLKMSTKSSIKCEQKSSDENHKKRYMKKTSPFSKADYVNSSSGSSRSDSSSSTDSNTVLPLQRHRNRQRSHRVDARAIVTPPPFDMKGHESLRDYFVIFERYFSKKFNGDDYERSIVLAKFLTGDLLKVYYAKGGHRMRYQELKRILLKYYKKNKVAGRTHFREEFLNASPEPDEAYDIYGIRLADLAERAFPDDPKMRAKQLRTQFLQVLPETMQQKIEDTERSLRAASGGKKKHLAFDVLVDIARDLQGAIKKTRTVFWSSNPYHGTPFHQDMVKPEISKGTTINEGCHLSRTKDALHSSSGRDFDKERRSREMFRHSVGKLRYPSRNVECNYCKRKGHIRRECWRAAGACLICGKSHQMEQCPKYNPNYSARSKSRPRESTNNVQLN